MARILARKRRGFTLIEILIVAALISILSSIAIFSINEFFNIQTRKATFGELRQIATAMSFAQNDLTFYPRLNWLDKPKPIVETDQVSGLSLSTHLVTAVDYYGFIPGAPQSVTPIQLRVDAYWSGPYIGMSPSRGGSNRGGRSGICKVRLPEVFLVNNAPNGPSIVDYPADPWGQPYVFYQFHTGVGAGALGGQITPEFVTGPTQDGDFMTAIVSYGKNGYPGGNEKTSTAVQAQLEDGALYVKGDPLAGAASPYDPNRTFTLRTANLALKGQLPANLILENYTPVHYAVLNALFVPGAPDTDTGYVGVQDKGSDDLMIKF